MTLTHSPSRGFVDPGSPVFWVGFLLVFYGAGQIIPILISRMATYPAAGLLSALVWGLYGAGLMWLFYRMELFERRPIVTILGAFLWGAIVVAGIGVTASPAMASIVGSILGEDQSDWVAAISAPLVEEPLKMLGVITLALIPAAKIDSALDGLFYGLMVGLGFEVVESLLYTTNAVAAEGGTITVVFAMLVLRGFIAGLWSHPTFSGVTGASVGYYVSSPRPRRVRVSVGVAALLVAMVLHGLFDSPLLSGFTVLSVVVKGLPILVVLLLVLRAARDVERARFDNEAATEIDHWLVGDDERESLLHMSSRRAERKRVRKRHGRDAGRAMRGLQRSQIDLVETAIESGADSEEFEVAAERVRQARSSLAAATAGG